MQSLDNLDPERFLELNASLQKKKSLLRTKILEQGVIQKDKKNNFDNYTYLSEAGYKALISPLLAEVGLELTSKQVSTSEFKGTDKQPYGRRANWVYRLTDTQTGFFEESPVEGEGIDKGDKAIYKADTGSLKYYLANTFLIVSGDEPENDNRTPRNRQNFKKASESQVEALMKLYSKEQIEKIKKIRNVRDLSDLPSQIASGYIKNAMKSKENANNE